MIDQRNLVIAIALSLVVILAWSFLYDVPRVGRERARQQQAVEQQVGEPPWLRWKTYAAPALPPRMPAPSS